MGMCCALYLFILSIFHVLPTNVMADPAYTATDLILISCGALSLSNDTNGRSWVGDERSRFTPFNATHITAAWTAYRMDPSVSSVPYEKARVVFSKTLTYTLPVSAGPKFLRLYFYPTVYSHHDTSQSLISVTANRFTLLTNFSASLYSRALSQPCFTKEYVIPVEANQNLVLNFSTNANSYAFINGIEIVSMPDTLYFRGNDVPIKFFDGLHYLTNDTAFENLYRLNVGAAHVDIGEDTGMFRAWLPDDHFILGGDSGFTAHNQGLVIKYPTETPYSAPPTVYTSARITSNESRYLEWEFPVDSGFFYLLRLHFCEIQVGVTKQHQRVFTVSINNQAVETDADIISWSGGDGIPVFRDYVTGVVAADGRPGKQDILLSLKPNSENEGALLNGLEIFKLSDPYKSTLAALNMPPENKSRGFIVSTIIGSLIGVFAVVAAVSFLILRWRRQKEKKGSAAWTTSVTMTSRASPSTTSIRSDSCRYFTVGEIKSATNNFDINSIVGRGGFGYVHRGIIDNGATTVAIKRLNPSSSQGAREFLTEIDMLSKLRHLHLVSLIGYCDDEGEMVLVYDYMGRGSLRGHLYNTDNPPLTWKQRLQICMGAAKGLNYLHTGTQHPVIHRDVKSTNILLDHNWVAKISDFGLSKMGEANDSFTHISTNVKGTFGYLDPKYLSTHQLTRKSDVYAFGVVMFEVLSGRPAVDVRLDEEQHSLAGWARFCVREGEVDRLIDPSLVGQISPACLQVFVGIGGRSIHIQPLERPTMADVVMGLELALALQEATCSAKEEEDINAIVVSVDDSSKGEADRIMSEDYTSSSSRGIQSEP